MGDYREQYEQVDRKIKDLVEELDPGAFVTGFILGVEVIDDQNVRAVWQFCPPDQRPWQTLGLASFMIQEEQAATVKRRLEADD